MNLTEVEKVAVLFIALGPERTQRILDRLSAEEIAPIIEAMGYLGEIAPEVRRAVLEEVNGILMDQAAGRIPGQRGRPKRSEPSGRRPDLFGRLGPYLPERIDTDRIDRGAAGLDFDAPSEGRPPEDEP